LDLLHEAEGTPDPFKEFSTDFIAIDLIQHFVTPTWVEIVLDVADAHGAVHGACADSMSHRLKSVLP
jgi:hypothetical protein